MKTHASVFGEAFLGPRDSQGFSRAHLPHRAYDCEAMLAHCPYGQPGDRLWVREAYRFTDTFDADSPSRVAERCLDAGYSKPWAPLKFESDGDRRNWMNVGTPTYPTTSPRAGKLRPGIHMPRWASRIDLEITDVRVERLNDISESDAVDEGFYQAVRESPNGIGEDVIGWYRELWELINGASSWDANPWVWVVEFKRDRP
ncbi:hypothetical protein D3C87_1567900 [compost metagenome]